MASLKFVAASAFVATIIVLSTLVAWNVLVGPVLPPRREGLYVITPTPSYEIIEPTPEMKYFYEHGGQLTINCPVYWSYDDSAQTTSLPYRKIYHADKKSLMAVMDADDLSTSGDLWISDGGILYMVVDVDAQTTYFLDVDSMLNFGGDYLVEEVDPYIFDPEDGDYDDDGNREYYFKLDVRTLPKTDTMQQTIYINCYVAKVESAPSLLSQANVTGVSTTAYNYYTAECYVSGWDGEGYAIKVSRIVITVSSSGDNKTYVEDGYVRFTTLTLGDYTFTDYDWDYGSGRIKIDLGVASETQERDALYVYYERGAGSTWCKVNFKIYAKFPATGKTWIATIKIYYINPAGTISSFSQNVEFAS